MTVSITPCWKKTLERSLMLLAGLFWLGAALAGSIEPKQAGLVAGENGQSLTAEFAIALGPRLEEAAARGVTLHFRLEFTLQRKRWYWFDEHIASRNFDYKLAYQALTRQYRVSAGSQQLHFDTLDEALRALGRIGPLPVADKGGLLPGEAYRAAVRLSLDHGQLPKPLQVDAIADRDWRIDTKTLRWDLSLPADK